MPAFFFLFFLCLCNFAWAHPIPDLPVFGKFQTNGNSTILVEIDPRCFAEDPEQVPFLTTSEFEETNASGRRNLVDQATSLIQKSLEIRLGENPWFTPDLQMNFTNREGGDLSDEQIVFIMGKYQPPLGSNASFYQIRSKESAPYDLVFTNQIDGKPQRRVNVLFPGEESFQFDLGFMTAKSPKANAAIAVEDSQRTEEEKKQDRADARSTFISFARQGFVHVLPLGLDHILFVIGLFLLSRQWKPILYQVSIFTLAHTITLGLATLDLISAPSNVVEPIIAASIAVVALENIFFPGYRHSRLVIIFAFGLIHGLGFAGALSAFNLQPTSLAVGLLGFNLGVEFGQLAVIAIVYIATFWITDKEHYRKFIVTPLSALIGFAGIYWTIERVFF
jgi:hydrogenase/urease accessory protein HupE